ncbi:acyl-CoA carboxylase epsilon subunit [Nocardioides ginsengisoli]|uniref:Acyl-CoA carboxylase epsilon subunit n=1 Tax=Nocardioides ginsengisoli TaxID=363868 RepID=A0ABW3VYK2_9ACTN
MVGTEDSASEANTTPSGASAASLVSSEQENSVSAANTMPSGASEASTMPSGASEASTMPSGASAASTMPSGREAPLLRIVTPDTTPEEIAAIVAVFSALGGSAPTPEPPRSEWADPARGLRRTGHSLTTHGRGAWRASGLPR